MMNRGIGLVAVAFGLVAVGAGTPAAADEAKTPIAPMILNLVAPPPTVQPSDAMLTEAMRAPGPRPRSVAGLGEVQPDGSVRYGDVTVTIKNPCPEGTAHYEPPPLPGRRPRK